jgi:hypothetical protein
MRASSHSLTTPTPPKSTRRGLAWRWCASAAVALVVASAGAVVPAFAVPNLNANESRAIAILRNVCSAQSQFQYANAIDQDADGVGEYGFFAELAGKAPLRGHDHALTPPLFDARFTNVRSGCVRIGGYVFQMLLRDADGGWIAEGDRGGATGRAIDPARSGREWLCYAWPERHGWSGKRAFMITQAGDLFAVMQAEPPYSGDDAPDPMRAGWRCAAPEWRPACNERALDGNRWVIVG